MTCPQPGGRYAVSEVKGFIAFAGKTGVRGRVVSREGSLVGQAFIAGLVGGIGRGFATNTNLALQPGNVVVNGRRQQLGLGDIAQGVWATASPRAATWSRSISSSAPSNTSP